MNTRTAFCFITSRTVELATRAVSGVDMGEILFLGGTPGLRGPGSRPDAVCEWTQTEEVRALLARTTDTVESLIGGDYGVVYTQDAGDPGVWRRRHLERTPDGAILVRGA